MAVHTLHCLRLLFNSVPIAFYILGGHTVGSIDKLNRVVDRGMLDILGYPVVCSPFIRVVMVPGAVCALMKGSSVAASLVSTICMKPREGVREVSTIPNTHCS